MDTTVCHLFSFDQRKSHFFHFIFLQLDISEEQPEVQVGLMAFIPVVSWSENAVGVDHPNSRVPFSVAVGVFLFRVIAVSAIHAKNKKKM